VAKGLKNRVPEDIGSEVSSHTLIAIV